MVWGFSSREGASAALVERLFSFRWSIWCGGGCFVVDVVVLASSPSKSDWDASRCRKRLGANSANKHLSPYTGMLSHDLFILIATLLKNIVSAWVLLLKNCLLG